jgi:hypothetical protein
MGNSKRKGSKVSLNKKCLISNTFGLKNKCQRNKYVFLLILFLEECVLNILGM